MSLIVTPPLTEEMSLMLYSMCIILVLHRVSSMYPLTALLLTDHQGQNGKYWPKAIAVSTVCIRYDWVCQVWARLHMYTSLLCILKGLPLRAVIKGLNTCYSWVYMHMLDFDLMLQICQLLIESNHKVTSCYACEEWGSCNTHA